MKKLLAIILVLSAVNFHAQQISLTGNTPRQKSIKFTNALNLPPGVNLNGNSYLDFSKVSKVLLMDAGAPALPVFRESITVPTANPVTFQVLPGSYVEYQNIDVLPSKGSLKRNVNPAEVPYLFGSEYAENKFYPEQIASVSNPFTFRNRFGVNLSFTPFQYNPVTKVLRVYSEINLVVQTPAAFSPIREEDAFQSLYSALFLDEAGYTPVSDLGDLLIITPPNYQNLLTNFVDWKNESGIKTTVVTTAQTGSTPESIKSYITTFYDSNLDLTYVLFIGDHQNIPTYSYGTSGADEQFYSDSYYGQLTEEDFYPELLVGRLSGTTQQMPRILQKILNYETTPLAGTWMTNAIGIASNEGAGYGDEGEADFEHLRGIGDKLLEFGYNTIYEFYQDYQEGNDEWGDPTPEMISAAIDEGVGLINYTGHGATQIMSTGSYTNADVNQLNNAGKFPFVVSVACNNGTFVGGTALCESFLTAGQGLNPTGAIAACGSSILMAWAEPMQTQDEIAALITRANPTSTTTTLGGLFFNGQLSMLETYGNSPSAIEVMQTWIMFGDPTVVFRSTSFDELAATHPAEVSQSGQAITVNSSSNGARVFLTQNNVQVATGVIAEGGATLDIPNLASNDPIKITLTKVNAKPYRSSINVSSPLSVDGTSSKNVQVFPNPVRNVLTVNLFEAEKAAVKILDLNGRVVLEHDFNSNSAQIDMSQLSNGMYLAVVETSNGRVIKKLSKE
ncbi:C25 family cysteine peptidase [Flavobacterium aurantiibacter]|uniref:Gingipain R n=1 Tax=Flavobacterium aurantiibacter TaxID=2023067 RepID=A0A255ZPA9_9FLAO|nr:C25 family cysteine peptidase [Flavobacterium aurantiibacter]OYQ43239.1 hypothetical protein CHX27_10920 [Flavobacterium aurantiibacter]